ncbi:MAG: class I SAM-dependent methyltransferase [Verrucomicrobiota bacterium]
MLDPSSQTPQIQSEMDPAARNPTTRFSDRVENYVKYRPSYPAEVIAALEENCGLNEESVIADVGSGTGISTKLFLDHGNRVFAIEPNREMREAAEKLLGDDPNFTSMPNSAEDTGLPDAWVDFIVAGQAFHWFDQIRTKKEFRRILRPGGWVVLVWNERETDTTPFLREYETFLHKHATDYGLVNHMNINEDALREFYAPASFRLLSFTNSQTFDLEGLKGRCLSSSYIPNKDAPGHAAMVSELEELFGAWQEEGFVRFGYRTNIFFGQLEK